MVGTPSRCRCRFRELVPAPVYSPMSCDQIALPVLVLIAHDDDKDALRS
jgi:hypothetical protein